MGQQEELLLLHCCYPQSRTPQMYQEPNLHPTGCHDAEGKPAFLCWVCYNIYTNWIKCDGHIRATHSCIAYGPCPMYMMCSTFNSNSWCLHIEHACPFLKAQGGECDVPELTKASEMEHVWNSLKVNKQSCFKCFHCFLLTLNRSKTNSDIFRLIKVWSHIACYFQITGILPLARVWQ